VYIFSIFSAFGLWDLAPEVTEVDEVNVLLQFVEEETHVGSRS
jgi:hypothetical protein